MAQKAGKGSTRRGRTSSKKYGARHYYTPHSSPRRVGDKWVRRGFNAKKAEPFEFLSQREVRYRCLICKKPVASFGVHGSCGRRRAKYGLSPKRG